MCQTIKDSTMASSTATMTSLAPSARSFKRSFKPRTARKASASTRISLNRFWNELEEFYNRYDDRRARNLGKDLIGNTLPAYTTDTFDHDREAAENALNERLEAAASHQQPPALPPKMTACRCQHQLPSPPPCDSIDSIFDSDKVKSRQMNYSVDSEVDSSFGSLTSSDNEDEDDEVFFTTNPTDLPQIPRPPRTLLDLIQRMSVGADL